MRLVHGTSPRDHLDESTHRSIHQFHSLEFFERLCGVWAKKKRELKAMEFNPSYPRIHHSRSDFGIISLQLFGNTECMGDLQLSCG